MHLGATKVILQIRRVYHNGDSTKFFDILEEVLYPRGYIKVNEVGLTANYKEESKKGHTGDALALRGDEGRDKLRKAAGIRK